MGLHFERAEYDRRIAATRAAMEAQGLDGLLMFQQESMYYLTGYDTFGFCFFQCLYLGADGKLALEASPVVFARAESYIAQRVGDLRAFEPCLADPEDRKQHHAMRIAAKRLRYTMELFKPIYEGGLDRGIEAIKQVQSLLGDVHDCDVWIAQLDKMLQKESKRFVRHFRHAGPLMRLQRGLDFLKEDRRRRRDGLFSTLVAFWHERTEAGLWEELAEVVGARSPLPDEAPQAADPWRPEPCGTA